MESTPLLEAVPLRRDLIRSLEGIYRLPAFGALAELLQGEALILTYLHTQSKTSVSPSQLSDQLHLSRSRMTGALSSLRRKELIRMEPCQTDRRRIEVSITALGRSRISGQLEEMTRYFDRMIAGLGDGDTRQLIALIDRCMQIMEE